MLNKFLLTLFVLMFASSMADAKDNENLESIQSAQYLTALEELNTQAIARVEAQLFSKDEFGRFEKAYRRNKELLKDTTTLADLTPKQVSEVFSNEQFMKTLFELQDEGDQQVCVRQRKLGSNLYETVCETKRDAQEAKDGAQGYLRRPKICVPPGCGGN